MRNIRSRVVVVSALAAAVALCPGVAASATPDTVTNASADADGSAAQRVDDRPDPQDAERRAGIEEAVVESRSTLESTSFFWWKTSNPISKLSPSECIAAP